MPEDCSNSGSASAERSAVQSSNERHRRPSSARRLSDSAIEAVTKFGWSLLHRAVDSRSVPSSTLFKTVCGDAYSQTCWYFEGQAVEGFCALTIDDAPARGVAPGFVDEVLKLLDENEAKATFFLMSRHAEAHFEHLRSILAHGCAKIRPAIRLGVCRRFLLFYTTFYTTDRHELGNHLVDDEPATGFTAVRALPISVLRSSSRIAVRMTPLVARLQDEFTTKLAECQAHIDRCATYAAARTHAACSVRHTSRNICAETRPHLRRDRKRSMCPSASGRGVSA